MRHSLLILAFFAVGITLGLGLRGSMPAPLADGSAIGPAIFLLLVLVGVLVGSDLGCFRAARGLGWRIALVPMAIIIGTLGAAWLAALALGVRTGPALASAGGFGFASLSSALLAKEAGPAESTLSLLVNLMRESFTFVFTPLLARWAGGLGPVASGGATAMDTTLPVIIRHSGSHFTVVAVVSGLVLCALVPVITPLLLRLGS
jgi:uncharacterized membrane protein YbjE (DUF340 family)